MIELNSRQKDWCNDDYYAYP